MYESADMSLWHGRVDDGPHESSRRWHQCVAAYEFEDAPSGVALLGVACDEGVRRNHGRVGAASGPDAIRTALANQAWHHQRPLYDAGNLRCAGDLEEMQQEQGRLVRRLLDLGHFPLLLGGGHEIAYGSFLGLAQHLESQPGTGPIGIINFDAHFDLRRAEVPTSGTPFMQVVEFCRDAGQPFHYACLGVSEAANTGALFDEAEQLGVLCLRDEELNSWQLAQAEKQLIDFLRPCRALCLSIDLDVLPAAVAPGVSAPAARGVGLAELEQLLKCVREVAGERLKLAEIAEYNPHYDIDDRTARVAARLCHLLVR